MSNKEYEIPTLQIVTVGTDVITTSTIHDEDNDQVSGL